jgi:hypothetical protein
MKDNNSFDELPDYRIHMTLQFAMNCTCKLLIFALNFKSQS